MGCPERVVHVHVKAGRQLLREGQIVLLFFRVEPDVLQHHDLALLHRAYSLLDLGPDRFVEETHGFADQLAESFCHRREREL